MLVGSAEAARKQWRQFADLLRPRVPKLAAIMGEADVVAYMSTRQRTGRSCIPPTRSSGSTA